MSRELWKPYSGPGYMCEDCMFHVKRRKRHDRANLCTECGVNRMAQNARLFATQGKAVYRALVLANGAASSQPS